MAMMIFSNSFDKRRASPEETSQGREQNAFFEKARRLTVTAYDKSIDNEILADLKLSLDQSKESALASSSTKGSSPKS
jgi:hypothetical protein